MWPWGHLAVGYLAYALLLDRRFRRPPTDPAVLVLALATQLPDLVDKPLAWHLALIPHGRSLAHSLLIATAVILLLGWYLRSSGRPRLALAFAVGYYSHLAADAVGPVLEGRWADLFFLGWPITAAPPGLPDAGILAFFATLARDLAAGDVSAFFLAEAVLVIVAVATWAAHGFPGLAVVRRVLSPRTRHVE